MKIKHKVYINSYSSSSCAGSSSTEMFQNILDGKTGIAQDKEYFYDSTPAIGKIDSKNYYEDLVNHCKKILIDNLLEDFSDTVLMVGTSVGGMKITEDKLFRSGDFKGIDPQMHSANTIAYFLQKHFNFYDTMTFSTACTSSANAIGYAYETLSKGIYKKVLVVGADQLCQTTVGGFLSLSVLSSNPCKPFDKNRDGMNVAEAIACLFLNTEVKENSIEVCGVGYSSDAHHMTQPHPDGLGAVEAISSALKSANIKPEDVTYINAHGTGTWANDSAEANAISTLFGKTSYVSSTKSVTGHTLGAAGAIEAIISCKVIQEGIIPKSLFLEDVENENINLSVQNEKKDVKYVVSNSFAFGGNNCSLVFGKVN
jgi:3-oxoacyl-[acyl-carrier-protein] synthase-1